MQPSNLRQIMQLWKHFQAFKKNQIWAKFKSFEWFALTICRRYAKSNFVTPFRCLPRETRPTWQTHATTKSPFSKKMWFYNLEEIYHKLRRPKIYLSKMWVDFTFAEWKRWQSPKGLCVRPDQNIQHMKMWIGNFLVKFILCWGTTCYEMLYLFKMFFPGNLSWKIKDRRVIFVCKY